MKSLRAIVESAQKRIEMSLYRRCPHCQKKLGLAQVFKLGVTKNPGYCPYCSVQIYKNDVGTNLSGVLLVSAVIGIVHFYARDLHHGRLVSIILEVLIVGLIGYYMIPLKDCGMEKKDG